MRSKKPLGDGGCHIFLYFFDKEMKKNYMVFWVILIVIVLVGIYFIKVNIEKGANYNVKSSVLGIIIFHNPFVLIFYLVLITILIVRRFKSLK